MAEGPSGSPDPNGAEALWRDAAEQLAGCETAPETFAWVNRLLANAGGASAAFLWTPDPSLPAFQCAAAAGDAVPRRLRAAAPREGGLLHDLLRDREPLAFDPGEIVASSDPLLAPLPPGCGGALALPLLVPAGSVTAVSILALDGPEAVGPALEDLAALLPVAAAAAGRAARLQKRQAGMLHAIERLTNLYDVCKAFGSTLDWSELTATISRKAADLLSAEVASLWLLDEEGDEVALGSTAVNESYAPASPPEAVGAGLVGDVIAGASAARDNDASENRALREDAPGYAIRSLLAVPLLEEGTPLGALVVANRRGGASGFSEADEELLQDLGHQAVRALRNARRYGAERKVEELDALLAVSREITATLDLDRVMNAIVNSASALLRFDRCALAILHRGKLRLGAVSGAAEINREDPSIRRTRELIEWAFYAGREVSVVMAEDGTIDSDRGETREKFRKFFEESGMRSYHAAILQDDEGRLGVLAFEIAEPLVVDAETQDLLQIIANQATVALRNAQLYQQVPLAGFWKPLLERRRKIAEIPARKRLASLAAAAAAALLLILFPWTIRLGGVTRILPGRQIAVTAAVEGVVASVSCREGDAVRRGQLLATLEADAYRAELASARADLEIAASDAERSQARGDPAASAEAATRREQARARIDLASRNLADTEIRAPGDGVVLTPHLEEKVGQKLSPGSELCRLANASTVRAEVEIPEEDAGLAAPGEPGSRKMNAYPRAVFRGSVTRVGAEIHGEGEQRFLTLETAMANPSGRLLPGMLGRGKIAVSGHHVGYALLRGPARYLWLRLWPRLP